MTEENSEDAFDKVKKGFKKVVGGSAEVVEGAAQGVKEAVEDTAEGAEENARDATDSDTYKASYGETKNSEPLNPEDIVSHKPTALQRNEDTGISEDVEVEEVKSDVGQGMENVGEELEDTSDKVQAGTKAVAKKIVDPDKALESEYEKEKVKERMD
jgi:hypothetical protein